jgi:hypothetical protein
MESTESVLETTAGVFKVVGTMGKAGSAKSPKAGKHPLTFEEENRAIRRRWLVRLMDTIKRALLNLLCLFFCLTVLACAQAVPPELGSTTCRGLHFVSAGGSLPSNAPGVSLGFLTEPAALPRMAPKLALSDLRAALQRAG